jgi:hypothetical protein
VLVALQDMSGTYGRRYAFRGGLDRLMLPDPDWCPACPPKPVVRVLVASAIGLDLLPPPLRVLFRPGGVIGAAMPEARVDEDGDPRGGEDDVRLSAQSGNGLSMNEESEAEVVER